jgi:ppGpp synthetase/RelA/SpoT-type nucleotidyltranferase
MGLPISRSALDRLGERLAASPVAEDSDLDLLEQVLGAYQDALDTVETDLATIGYQPTTRLKTTGTLIEKLRRETGMKLKGVQDVAGARIITTGSRADQDEMVQKIVATFKNETRPPRVKDRREEPSAGYRAVHVIVTVDGVPVEVQVRTLNQDLWAQIVERLADRWGREIRYGGSPPEPQMPAPIATFGTRTDFLRWLVELSDSIADFEQTEQNVGELEASTDRLRAQAESDTMRLELAARRDDLTEVRGRLTETRQRFREALETIGDALERIG